MRQLKDSKICFVILALGLDRSMSWARGERSMYSADPRASIRYSRIEMIERVRNGDTLSTVNESR